MPMKKEGSLNFRRYVVIAACYRYKTDGVSIVDPEVSGTDPDPHPNPRIRTTDLRILLFLSVTFKMPKKNNFFLSFFCLLPVLFEGTLKSFFNDKKVIKKSHKGRN
jgi:hypothetical protein